MDSLLGRIRPGLFADGCRKAADSYRLAVVAGLNPDEASARCDRERDANEERKRHPLLGVPAKFHDASLDTADQMRPAILEVMHYLEFEHAQGKCLILSGETQAGKTFAAVCALREVKHQRRMFCVYSAAVDDLAFQTRENAEARRAIFETTFVVLDDIGAECAYQTGSVQERFAERIIFEREQRVLPTIITTNLDPNGFSVRVGKRAAARISEGWGRFFVVERPRP